MPHNVVVYLGSTVGNIPGAELVSFLAAIRARLNDGDHLLLGYDLLQTPAKHLATYPADRTLGELFEAVLNRMRREVDADIIDDALAVEVVFDESDGAVLGRSSRRGTTCWRSAVGRGGGRFRCCRASASTWCFAASLSAAAWPRLRPRRALSSNRSGQTRRVGLPTRCSAPCELGRQTEGRRGERFGRATL